MTKLSFTCQSRLNKWIRVIWQKKQFVQLAFGLDARAVWAYVSSTRVHAKECARADSQNTSAVVVCINHRGDNTRTFSPEVPVTFNCVHKVMPRREEKKKLTTNTDTTQAQAHAHTEAHTVYWLYDKENPSLILLSWSGATTYELESWQDNCIVHGI